MNTPSLHEPEIPIRRGGAGGKAINLDDRSLAAARQNLVRFPTSTCTKESIFARRRGCSTCSFHTSTLRHQPLRDNNVNMLPDQFFHTFPIFDK